MTALGFGGVAIPGNLDGEGSGLVPGKAPLPWPRITSYPQAFAARSPLVRFYEVTLTNGEVVRFASYGDVNLAPGTGTTVDFLGEEWTVIDGAGVTDNRDLQDVPGEQQITIGDPTRAVTNWLRVNRLSISGARVRFFLAFADNLDEYRERQFLVLRWGAEENPARATVIVGPPPLTKKTCADRQFQQFRCEHPWHLRYHHKERINGCNFPSEDFGPATAQTIRRDLLEPGAGETGEKEFDYGWYARGVGHNTAGLGFVVGNFFATGQISKSLNRAPVGWKDGLRNACFMYRLIGLDPVEEEDTLVDFYTQVQLGANNLPSFFAGLCVQSIDDSSKSIIWGRNRNNRALLRVTDNDVSDDTFLNLSASGAAWIFRLRRTDDDTWEAWADVTDRQLPEDWPASQKFFTKTLAMSGPLRVGLMYCEDPVTTSASGTAIFNFRWIRFFSGGFKHCQQTLSACAKRKFLHRNLTFRGLTDGTIFR